MVNTCNFKAIIFCVPRSFFLIQNLRDTYFYDYTFLMKVTNRQKQSQYHSYRNDPKFSDRQVLANSANPDQTDQGLHCL